MNQKKLTEREKEITNKLLQTNDGTKLAEELGITKSTLRDHFSSIRSKLGCFENEEPTPPAPDSLKNELYFDRAEQHCEWCGEWLDMPQTHHIDPRREGGTNDRSNLIVLCSNCHSKADRGAISRTKLKAKLRRISD